MPSPLRSILTSRGFVVFLAFLFGIEALLRLGPLEAVLPPPRPYHSDEVELRRRAMRDLQRAHGPIDALFLGNSSARTAISPTVFDSVVARRSARPILSYNGSLSGVPPAAVGFFLHHFYLAQVQPRVVFEGVTLAALKRPVTEMRWERFASGILEQAWRGATPLDRLQEIGMENSQILYHRGFLGSIFVDLGRPRARFADFPMDDRGYEERTKSIPERSDLGDVEPYPAGPLAIDEALEAIRRSAELCESRGIAYVLVRLPEHARKFEGRDAVQREYRERLIEFSRREGILYLDVVGQDMGRWADDRLFNDMGHPTVTGARLFTTLLAEAWISDVPVERPAP